MAKISKKRKLRFGSVGILLCVLAITCVVIVNVIAGALCLRYDWMYLEMNRPAVYEISDACRDYIREHIITEVDNARRDGNGEQKIKVIFCDGGTENSSEELYKYIYDSFFEISEMFPGYFEIEHLNVWDEPSRAKEYGVDSSEDIVCVFNGRHETMNLKDFYIIETNGYESTPVAYNGEKIIASCLLRVTQSETPMCYLTVNHGEVYGDYEFVRMVSEAGYSVGFIDLYAEEIPEDCDILVTYDPKKDLAEAGDSSLTSEVAKLDEYMSEGGKYMVFLSADTFASGGFDNLEGFLSTRGIEYMHKTTDEGVEACYLVKDSANSLTVDGYTVLSENSKTGIGASIFGNLKAQNSFGNTTYISVAEGFSPDGNGNYVSADKTRTFAPLMLSHSTAVAWADGRAVARASDNDFILMSLTEQKCENGKTGYLVASASVDFASEDAMQSSVLGNSRALSEIIKYMGKDNVPSNLVFKPFGETEIQSLTSRNANIITVIMVALPAVAVAAVGAVVLIRRRNR
ncbi:MAG: Gldg family protein [Eubacteriales bacterium]